MSSGLSNAPAGRANKLPWLALACIALALAVVWDQFIASSLLLYPKFGAPNGIVLAHNCRKFPYAFAALFLILGMSGRWSARFTGRWPLLVGALGLTGIHFGLCYFVLVVTMGGFGGGPLRRLPTDLHAVIEQHEQMELLSIWPSSVGFERPTLITAGEFRRYPVLGRAEISDASTRNELAHRLLQSIEESSGAQYLCFHPRHGLRVRKGDVELDLVLCFECSAARIHRGEALWTVALSRGTQPDFDRALKRFNIPLAPTKEELMTEPNKAAK